MKDLLNFTKSKHFNRPSLGFFSVQELKPGA